MFAAWFVGLAGFLGHAVGLARGDYCRCALLRVALGFMLDQLARLGWRVLTILARQHYGLSLRICISTAIVVVTVRLRVPDWR